MMNCLEIDSINKIEKEEFIELMYQFFNSPAHTLSFIDEVEKKRPFLNGIQIYQEIILQIKRLPHIDQLKILKNQDELGIVAGITERNKYAKHEHRSSGLNNLSDEYHNRFKYLNLAYKAKFNFIFLCVVSGLNSKEILSIFEKRISNSFETEFFIAMSQLEKLTFLRLRENLACLKLKKISFLNKNYDY